MWPDPVTRATRSSNGERPWRWLLQSDSNQRKDFLHRSEADPKEAAKVIHKQTQAPATAKEHMGTSKTQCKRQTPKDEELPKNQTEAETQESVDGGKRRKGQEAPCTIFSCSSVLHAPPSLCP